ncbi:hypothetical protein VZT92_000311 [Zoarces viviparus]|uniref:Uncharacterized protein n=1 Tax=Zoarces viviparus TaxID=48416 RepID=A0AAW1G5I0_ZOAVI
MLPRFLVMTDVTFEVSKGMKVAGCDRRREDSLSAATCRHQRCGGVMGRDWRGPGSSSGRVGCQSRGPSGGQCLKWRSPPSLAKQPAPNLAAPQPVSQ